VTKRSIFFVLLMLFCQLGIASSSEGGGEAKEAKSAPGSIKSTYMRLEPPIIANYGTEQGRLRFVKVDITLRVELGGENPVVHHMPALRHELVMLITRQTNEAIGTTEGKELMRQEALEAVRNVLIAEEGDQKIADLLFNSFVVQR
jgi:flagellar FliL protein